MSTFPATLLAGHRYAVVGLGRNGMPAARALRGMGAEVVAWDDTEAARALALAEGFAVRRPEMQGLCALVLSPGIPHVLPAPHPLAAAARAAGVAILSDADLLFQAVRAAGSRARVTGITGTNGKSTTTALLAHILEGAGIPNAAGGNLGPAALALPLLNDDGVYVLEMSSYMLERLAAISFDTAAMLNLSPDHLDRHGDMAGYVRAKRRIFDRQHSGCTAVIGVDDGYSRGMADQLRGNDAQIVTISSTGPADIAAPGGVLTDDLGPICDLANACALPGAHNAQNAAAAAAMALSLGVSRAQVADGIASYPGLPHRQERVAEFGGVVFVNDSKGTNADATAWALACYDRVIWIAGGVAKADGIEPLARFFPRVAHAFLIGRDAPLLAATLRAHGVPHDVVGTLAESVPAAFSAARRLDARVVMLSPACASFDQFANFEARGDAFRMAVHALANAGPVGAR